MNAGRRSWLWEGHTLNIIDLHPENGEAIRQAASLLVAGFRDTAPDAWPDHVSALHEVHECLSPERICRVAIEAPNTVVGWIGAMPLYRGRVWELHPLVVHPAYRLKGIGRALVHDLEYRVGQQGGLTIWLGADDEQGLTSLSGVDVYPNVWEHVATIQASRRHPYAFYRKLGFVVAGVLPDANGLGKPDIFMAKRVGRSDYV